MGQINKNEKHYVYALCDPDTNEVRYVGVSIYPEVRLIQHMTIDPLDENRKKKAQTSREKDAWIGKLKESGKKPALIILDTCIGWKDARKKKRYYFDKYNNGNLVNSPERIYGIKKAQDIPIIILDPQKCQGITKKNKQCARKPDRNGFCCKHHKY
jgi:hypothetical protein